MRNDRLSDRKWLHAKMTNLPGRIGACLDLRKDTVLEARLAPTLEAAG